MKLSLSTNLKNGFSLKKLLCYFIFIPFFYPRGVSEYSHIFKLFCTAWLYMVMAVIVMLFIIDFSKGYIKYKTCLFAALAYYCSIVLLTLYTQHGLGAGLQKMIAAPALCLACGYYLKKDPPMILECITNILMVILGLTVCVFNSLFFGRYFNDGIHLMFIGHVQIGAQLGVLGILISGIHRYLDGKWKRRSILLAFFSVGTMILSFTSGSYISLMIIFCGLVYMRYSKNCKFLCLKFWAYWLTYIAANLSLFGILIMNNWALPFSFISLNGRGFIWKEGFRLFSERKLTGYGVYGVYIKVFWMKWVSKDSSGFNYAHNQMLQVLLDGGIVLFVVFLVMLWFYLKPIDKAPKQIRCFANTCLLSVIVVMVVESTFEYYYIVFFISMLAYLPELCRKNNTVRLIKELVKK